MRQLRAVSLRIASPRFASLQIARAEAVGRLAFGRFAVGQGVHKAAASWSHDAGYVQACFANEIPLCLTATPKYFMKTRAFDESKDASRTNRLFTGLTMTLGAVEQNVVNIVLKNAVLEVILPDFIAKPL